MNQEQFTALVAAQAGMTRAEARKAVRASLKIIKQTVGEGETVAFLRFGTFSTIEKNARLCNNPKTCEKVYVAAHKAIKFKPARDFKKLVK